MYEGRNNRTSYSRGRSYRPSNGYRDRRENQYGQRKYNSEIGNSRYREKEKVALVIRRDIIEAFTKGHFSLA